MIMENTIKPIYKRSTILLVVVLVLSSISAFGQQKQKLSNHMLTENYQDIKSFYDISVSIQEKNISLEEIFESLEKQMELRFLYNQEIISESEYRLDLNFTEASVADVLKEVAVQTGLTFRQINGTISVGVDKLREPVVNTEVQSTITIEGTVTDIQTGEALPGVNVIASGSQEVTGSRIGTTTDINGEYSIAVPEELNVLVFTYIGYQRTEVDINGRTNIDIELNAETILGEELVVVGYGVQRKSEVTGSVGVVSEEDLAQPTFNALQSLKGKVAGVEIFSNSGSPTGENRVVIRGVGTINASSNPLYVVDGVAMESISTMNPNDIESIEVLKDASATAIYGSRGANGVILVTTKRGADQNGLFVGYSGNVGIGRLANKMDAMNSEEFMEVQRIGYENAPVWGSYLPGEEPQLNLSDERLFDAQGNPKYDTDWQEEATRTAISQNHQFNIQYGAENSSFGAFLNYSQEEGVFLNSWLERASVKLVYDASPTEWLNVGSNLTINKTWANNVAETGGGFHASRAMVEVPPIFPVKWPDGSWSNSTQINGFTFEGQPNPVHRLQTEDRLNNGTRLFGNTFLEVSITPNLQLRTQFGLNNDLTEQRYYAPTNLITVGFPSGNSSIANSEITYWQNENYLTYINDFGEHRVNAVLGASWQQRLSKGNSLSAEGFSNDFFSFNNIGAASTHNPSSSFANDWTMNSYFSRATYTFRDTYSATFTGRVDGSSRFGNNNKYGFFPSGGVSWLVSNEKFMQDVNFIDQLRLRSSYGVTGNTEIGLYQSLATIGSGTVLINGSRVSNSRVQRLPNPDLSWERTKQFDLGIELSLFNQVLSIEADYYNKLTDDLILNRPVPTSTGFSSITDNIGSISNKGLDLKLTTRNISSNDFLWMTTLNFNRNINKVESLGTNDEDIFPGPNWVAGSQTILRVGEPVNSFWGYERLGTWDTDEVQEAAQVGAVPGEAKRSEQKKIIGNGLPTFTGSLINRFNFGNFDATVDFQFSYGADIMMQTLATAEDRQGLTNGIASQLHDAWTPENQNTMVQRIRHTVLSGQNLQPDTQWIQDGSYIRANLISLGYSFNQSAISSYGLRQLRVVANIENAFLIHSKEFKGLDPESSTWHGNNFGQNIFFYEYPKARTVTLGVNIQF